MSAAHAGDPTGERPATALARSAEHALKALAATDRDHLAATPHEMYTLLDHLTMVIGHAVTVNAQLADLLREWVELCQDTPTAGDTTKRLQQTRKAVGLGIVPDACQLYQRFEIALTALDVSRYRTERGIPLDWHGGAP